MELKTVLTIFFELFKDNDKYINIIVNFDNCYEIVKIILNNHSTIL